MIHVEEGRYGTVTLDLEGQYKVISKAEAESLYRELGSVLRCLDNELDPEETPYSNAELHAADAR